MAKIAIAPFTSFYNALRRPISNQFLIHIPERCLILLASTCTQTFSLTDNAVLTIFPTTVLLSTSTSFGFDTCQVTPDTSSAVQLSLVIMSCRASAIVVRTAERSAVQPPAPQRLERAA